jgi:hypothetical protein
MFKIYYDSYYTFQQTYPNSQNISKNSIKYDDLIKDIYYVPISENIGKFISLSFDKKFIIFKNFDNNTITHLPIQYIGRLKLIKDEPKIAYACYIDVM